MFEEAIAVQHEQCVFVFGGARDYVIRTVYSPVSRWFSLVSLVN